ncbi:MAG TPA: universal stress protein [Ferrovibrio sp.]|uniref:universal stress protein n=1 Tax=Ferrovibrio sp. TaxID=1917215 RepID=UPI002ED65A1C
MKKILVATDFSTRSDRAIRRGVLLAKEFDAAVTLLHVVDNDQPERILRAERLAASALLSEQAASLGKIDGVACDHSIALNDPFEGILDSVRQISPDLLVLGPHRRQALRDVFVGTTAERSIRASPRPVLMANGVPAGFYRHLLIATDLAAGAGHVARAVLDLGLTARAKVSVVHAHDIPAAGLIARAQMTESEIRDYLADEHDQAAGALASFVAEQRLPAASQVVRLNETSEADVICSVAKELAADLIVVGTRSRGGLATLVLGSVAQQVLGMSDVDVLAIPPGA